MNVIIYLRYFPRKVLTSMQTNPLFHFICELWSSVCQFFNVNLEIFLLLMFQLHSPVVSVSFLLQIVFIHEFSCIILLLFYSLCGYKRLEGDYYQGSFRFLLVFNKFSLWLFIIFTSFLDSKKFCFHFIQPLLALFYPVSWINNFFYFPVGL